MSKLSQGKLKTKQYKNIKKWEKFSKNLLQGKDRPQIYL